MSAIARWLVLLGLMGLATFGVPNSSASKWNWVIFRAIAAVATGVASYRLIQDEATQIQQGERDLLLEATQQVRELYEGQFAALKFEHQQLLMQTQAAHQQTLLQTQSAYQTQWEALTEQINLEKEQVNAAQEALLRNQEDLAIQRQHFEDWMEQITEHMGQREAALEQKTAEFYTAAHQQTTEMEQFLESTQTQLHQEFEAAWQEREDTYTQLAATAIAEVHKLRQPDLPSGGSEFELLAREAIRCLYAHGIIAKKSFVRVLTRNKFELLFEIIPIVPNADQKAQTEKLFVKDLAEGIKRIKNDLLPELQASVPGCKTLPTIEPLALPFKGAKLTFDVSGIDWKAAEELKNDPAHQVLEPPPEHFDLFISRNSHFALFGGTRTGKTVAVNNIVGCLTKAMGGDVKLKVGDAKLSVEMRALKPVALGAGECLLLLKEASEEVERRINLRREDYLKNLPLRTFERCKIIYMVDEINEVIRRFNRPLDPRDRDFLAGNDMPQQYAVSTYLLRIWQMGSELGVGSLIAGQNLMASQLKMNIVDLDNVGALFLGGAITVGINYRCKGKEKNEMEAEFELRRSARKLHPNRVDLKYYAMFSAANETPYMAKMPPVGAYNQFMPGTLREMFSDLMKAVGDDDGVEPDYALDLESAEALEPEEEDSTSEPESTSQSDSVVSALNALFSAEATDSPDAELDAQYLDLQEKLSAYLSKRDLHGQWIKISDLNKNWAGHQDLNREGLATFLSLINRQGLGEFGADAKTWRSLNLPKNDDFLNA